MTHSSPELPIAYLVGFDIPTQPDHPDPLARLGVTGTHSYWDDGELRHVRNEVRYSDGALVQVIRPGWDASEPRAAIAAEMHRIAVSRHLPFTEALEACAAERDPDHHEFEPATLRVGGVDYQAIEAREHGLIARAAVVDGWTVVACVTDGVAIEVALHTIAELTTA